MFSIIITTYNAEKTIAETLKSIRLQTYNNYEIIVVDDGSTDSTVEIIRNVKMTLNLDLYIKGKIGRSKALNYGVSRAKFDWIAILDADDLWHPKKLEIFEGMIKKFPDTDIWCNKTRNFSTKVIYDEIELVESTEIRINRILIRNEISHSSVIIKKSIVKYDESRISQVDYELWLRLLYSGHKASKILNVLSFHRIHVDQNYEGKRIFGYRYRALKLVMRYNFKLGKPLNFILVPFCTSPTYFSGMANWILIGFICTRSTIGEPGVT